MKKNSISLDQIEATVAATFNELEENIEPSELTADDKTELVSALNELEFKAYSIKMNLFMDNLIESSPDMPIRDVMIQMLAHLRPDASASMITKVAKYISEEWEKRRLKVAA
jgi:hypothetical protein